MLRGIKYIKIFRIETNGKFDRNAKKKGGTE